MDHVGVAIGSATGGKPAAPDPTQTSTITSCCGAPLAWFDEVKEARWSSAADVKRGYATISIVSANRIVFNVRGHDYRLVVAVDIENSIVWIKWVGTHRDYDKIDVKEVRHGG